MVVQNSRKKEEKDVHCTKAYISTQKKKQETPN
jgi:hypothetical protein